MSSAARRCSFDALVALALLVFICAVPVRAAAQVLYRIGSRRRQRSSGAAMPGATVLITNNNNGFKREAVTDGVGHFNLFDLPAGTYSLKATQQGFRTFEQTQVTVNINTVTRIDVTMEIGAMGDNVTVRAEAPALQTETAEVHSNLLGRELTNLPVPLGGNYQQVYRMLPGFAPPANSHSIPTNPARSLEFQLTAPATIRTTRGLTASAPPISNCHTSRHTSRPSSPSRKSTSSPAASTRSRDSPAVQRSTSRLAADRTRCTDRGSNISRTRI